MDDRFVLPDGDKIRQLRQSYFWSQEQLADKAGLRKRTIERAEAGERLQRSTLGAIAQALGLAPEGLISSGGSSEPRHDGPSTSAKPSGAPSVAGRGSGSDQARHEGGEAEPHQAETSLLQTPERCSSCGAKNPPGMHFCVACGLRLQSRCPRCGAEQGPGTKFCGACGSLLEGGSSSLPSQAFAPPQTPLSYTPVHLAEKIVRSRSTLEGERKQVTVLFAHLQGAAEMLADRDPEEAQRLLDPFLERMMAAIHRYEGTVNHIAGDGIIALFGAPLAHEDHAARACYAALAMQKAILECAKEVRHVNGIEIQLRAGLNSGEVVVRAIGNDLHMEYAAVGQTMYLAAQLEQLAPAGAIWLTAETLRLVEGFVQVKALGPVPMKGLTDPIEIYELIGTERTRTRLQVATSRVLTPFVGRQYEIETLRQALERARTGHGQVVAVIGEPGVGKSRLFLEFTQAQHTQGWCILETGTVSSYGKGTPYLPIIDHLKAYFQVEDPDDGRSMAEKVTDKLLALDEALRPTLPAFFTLLDMPVEDLQWQAMDPRHRRQRILDAVKRWLLRESQAQPLLVIVENLHWIDTETQAVLDSVVESLPTARLLLLVNYRPEYQHSWGNKTYYTQLRLDPLPSARAEELLQALVGRDTSLQPLTQRLIERTEGNPFFLEESVWALAETKALVGERGAYRLAQVPPSIQVPTTVQAVLAARIDRLPLEEKRLLQAAAVIGRDVPFSLLQAIADTPEEVVRQSLTHLQAAEFLYELQLFPEHVYTFKHALTQEVAYQSLLRRTRQHYHQQIAQVLAELFPGTIVTQPNLLAHHYTEAGLSEQAIPYWQQAGQRAIERSAHVEAIIHLTKGLEVLGNLPKSPELARHELTLQLSLGTAFALYKGWASPEAEFAFTRASELCRQVGDGRQRLWALLRLMHLNRTKGRLRMWRDLSEEGLILAENAQDPALIETMHQDIGSVMFFMGEPAAALEHLEQCVARHHRSLTFDVGFEPAVMSLSRAAWALWMLGYPDRALTKARAALALAQELSHPHSLVIALQYSGLIHQARREAPLAQERAEAVIAFSSEQGFTYWLAAARNLRGWALAEQGRAGEGIAELRQGLATWRALGAGVGLTHIFVRLAEAYKRQGQVKHGLSVLDEALAAVHEREERYYESEIYRLKGELLLLQDMGSGEAERCFRRALDVACQQQAKSLELRAAMSVSRLWQHQGMRGEPYRFLAKVYSWFTEGFETPDLQDTNALLKMLA